MITDTEKQEFIAGYLTAALWSSSATITDEDGSEEYVNLDDYDWADGEAEKLHADCHDFMQEYGRLLERYSRARVVNSAEYTVWECIGHDFWLTRNGHGAGFWDGRGGVVGDLLTKRCGFGTPYAGIGLTLGDDELVYAEVRPTAYIVETRNMHTAGHEWWVYASLSDANQARTLFEAEDTTATEKHIGWKSINFRSPPAYWYLEPGNVLHNVRVVNAGHIPDVF